MKTMLKTFSAVALLGTLALRPAFADDTTTVAAPTDTASDTTPTDAKDQKDLKKVIEDQGINYVETAQKGITLSGYVDTSYTYQFAGGGEASAHLVANFVLRGLGREQHLVAPPAERHHLLLAGAF